MRTTLLIVSLFVSAVLAGTLFFSCNRQPSGAAGLRTWFLNEHNALLGELQRLDSLARSGAALTQMQRQFAGSRFRYKRIEGIVEYYFQGLTRRINGPAIADVRTDDNQVWPPHGFQVVEQYLYGGFADSLRLPLREELALLQSDLRFVTANMGETAILPRHVREIVQHQVIRVATLGITGMDAPLSRLSIPEASAALSGIADLLRAYNGKALSPGAERAMAAAIGFVKNNNDFDGFDRLTFLRLHLAPLSTVLKRSLPADEPGAPVFAKPFSGTLADLLQGNGFDADYYANYSTAGNKAAKIALGKRLFFDPILSKQKTTSCATCHQPGRSFTDGLPKAANPVHGGSLPRNTPTLYYAALQRDQFYDHRSATLEDQVHEVMRNEDEFDLDAVQAAAFVSGSRAYSPMAQQAFGKTVLSGYEVRHALAAYIRTLSPFASRFDAYMRGDAAAMNKEEINGFNLFAGKAKCATCHFIPLFNGTVPPWFTKSESEIIGVPEKPLWERASVDLDPGRYRWNQLEPLRYAFKTPTVRNSAQTAPYMHNGVYKTLDEVVRFYHKGGGVGLGMNLPYQTLPFDSLQLNLKEEQAIVAFLHTLSDER